MSVKDNANPEFGLNHSFNTDLGILIAGQSDDAQGTLMLLFKQMKTSSGDPRISKVGIQLIRDKSPYFICSALIFLIAGHMSTTRK